MRDRTVGPLVVLKLSADAGIDLQDPSSYFKLKNKTQQ